MYIKQKIIVRFQSAESFLGGNIKDGTYFRMIFRILAGINVMLDFPSMLAFGNSEVNLS